MNIPRILIGAAASGSGKTLLTCGLLQLLSDEKKKIAAFKCGPDYIDPMFHRNVLGVPSKNLDTFFTGEELTKRLFLESAEGVDAAVLEGVMGLYDGLGGIREEGSAYHLAQVTKTPILLVVDAHGMGRSLLPVVKGFLDFDRENLICGIFLNRTSQMFYDVIKPEIEQCCSIPVLGYLPKIAGVTMESRHLGLITPQEIPDIRKQIRAVAEKLRETLDVSLLLSMAEQAKEIAAEKIQIKRITEKVKIAVAQDEAFCFYYEDNLSLLEEAGAELIPFSPMRDAALPKGICGLLFGGGYPELYAEQLSQNNTIKNQIAHKIAGGMPVIAECGGFMYLHERMQDVKGQEYSMVPVVPGTCFYTGKLVRFGYVKMREKAAHFLPETQKILGHEFHYFDSTANGDSCLAKKPVSGRQWDCIHVNNTAWMGFPHLYYYSNPEYVYRFLEKAVHYGQKPSACFH